MSLIASYIGEKCVDHAVGHMVSAILGRASDARKKEFFEQFTQTIETSNTQGLAVLLGEVDKDPEQAEILFNAFRSALFSRSRILAPRFIAYQTACVMTEMRNPTFAEQEALLAAESLDDSELLRLAKYIETNESETQNTDSERFRIELDSFCEDSNWRSNGEIPNQLSMEEYCGPWAIRCQSLGIVRQYSLTSSTDYQADGERHIEEDGTLKTTTFYLEYGVSAKLISSGIRKVSIGTKYYW